MGSVWGGRGRGSFFRVSRFGGDSFCMYEVNGWIWRVDERDVGEKVASAGRCERGAGGRSQPSEVVGG